jgi:hypothetical protein
VTRPLSDKARYLGDGLYADFDGWMISLTADHGSENERTVYLEEPVYEALVRYVADLKRGE